MPFTNIYQSSSKYAINDLVKEMDLSLWKSMLNNIAEVLNAPAVAKKEEDQEQDDRRYIKAFHDI